MRSKPIRCDACRDWDQPCSLCARKQQRRDRRNAQARARRRALSDAMDSVGMRRVRGTLGGTAWE